MRVHALLTAFLVVTATSASRANPPAATQPAAEANAPSSSAARRPMRSAKTPVGISSRVTAK